MFQSNITVLIRGFICIRLFKEFIRETEPIGHPVHYTSIDCI